MAVKQKVGALVANAVTTLVCPDDAEQIEVWADETLTFRVDGVDPVLNDEQGYNLPEPGARIVSIPTAGDTVVKLISATPASYVVTVV